MEKNFSISCFLLTASAIIMAATIPASCDSSGPESVPKPPEQPENMTTYGYGNLVAVRPDGKEIGFDGYPAPKDRKVGIFYFVWIGAHGYDTGTYNGGDILPPSASDVNSPYDISILERGYTDPQDVPYGPYNTMHHWGEPYLGYYVSNDSWVIRRHAQMLTAAGVDAIFIDLTNGLSYLPVLTKICDIYTSMIRELNTPPKISFVLNTAPEAVMPDLKTLYDNSDYDRLWFTLDGKPLILAPPGDYGFGAASMFTFRQTWFDSQYGHGGQWWGDGTDKWTWGEFYPQRNVKEEMSVMAGSHAHLNVGRSYSGNSPEGYGGFQPQNTTAEQRAAGTYFSQQFERAIQCDPDFIFITGWNEWTAQRQIIGDGMSPATPSFIGRPIGEGDTYFVDCYNHEYSRDIEPCADDFKDTYYYYMVDFIRQYKGIEPVSPVGTPFDISIDSNFDDWVPVDTRYGDFSGDTQVRNHFGYGYKNLKMTNTTGRNDITFSKVATNLENLYFYVEAAEALTPSTDRDWMKLFISIKGSESPDWEGFQWKVENYNPDSGKASLSRCEGGWEWTASEDVAFAVSENRMEIAIPLAALGIKDARNFTVDFKWIDNSVPDGDICECMSDGDSAPDSRFRYRYIFKY